MTLFTENPLEKSGAIPLYRLLSETGTGEEAHRAGTLKGGFFHGI